MNRSIYAYLSRESHARLRVDPVGYRISPDGSLSIVQRQADEAEKHESALRCLDSSIAEAIGALSYFLDRSEREHAEEIRLAAMEAGKESLQSDFDPDLGLHLAGTGVGSALIEFSTVPVQNLAVLPNGTVAWSAGLRLAVRCSSPPSTSRAVASPISPVPLRFHPKACEEQARCTSAACLSQGRSACSAGSARCSRRTTTLHSARSRGHLSCQSRAALTTADPTAKAAAGQRQR